MPLVQVFPLYPGPKIDHEHFLKSHTILCWEWHTIAPEALEPVLFSQWKLIISSALLLFLSLQLWSQNPLYHVAPVAGLLRLRLGPASDFPALTHLSLAAFGTRCHMSWTKSWLWDLLPPKPKQGYLDSLVPLFMNFTLVCVLRMPLTVRPVKTYPKGQVPASYQEFLSHSLEHMCFTKGSRV